MGKKIVKPSAEATRRARRHRLFLEYQDESQYLKVLLATGFRVVYSYAGHEIDFTMKEGVITRGKVNDQYLSQEDWVFLFKHAEELMKAVFAGYKRKRKNKNGEEFPEGPVPQQGTFKF